MSKSKNGNGIGGPRYTYGQKSTTVGTLTTLGTDYNVDAVNFHNRNNLYTDEVA